METFVVVIEGIAFIAFAYASFLAFLRYKEIKKEINLWCQIALALFLFSLSSLMDVFESSIISSDAILYSIFENFEITFMLVGSAILFSVLCLYYKCRKCQRFSI